MFSNQRTGSIWICHRSQVQRLKILQPLTSQLKIGYPRDGEILRVAYWIFGTGTLKFPTLKNNTGQF